MERAAFGLKNFFFTNLRQGMGVIDWEPRGKVCDVILVRHDERAASGRVELADDARRHVDPACATGARIPDRSFAVIGHRCGELAGLDAGSVSGHPGSVLRSTNAERAHCASPWVNHEQSAHVRWGNSLGRLGA